MFKAIAVSHAYAHRVNFVFHVDAHQVTFISQVSVAISHVDALLFHVHVF